MDRATSISAGTNVAVAAVTAKNRVANAVAIDDTTAGLLGPTFVVQASSAGLALEAERAETMQVRTLLGKPTPCVGRDRELAFLDATLAECESDDVARSVLVTGPAGVGNHDHARPGSLSLGGEEADGAGAIGGGDGVGEFRHAIRSTRRVWS